MNDSTNLGSAGSIRLSVFDPPMCCSTGVCGPDVDPALPRFAADLAWLAEQGIGVRRFNLAQEPLAFTDHAVVRGLLGEHGSEALPALLVDDQIVHRGSYPSRKRLAELLGLPAPARRSLAVVGETCGCGPEGCC